MVYGAPLERVCGVTATAGSNPALSAIKKPSQFGVAFLWCGVRTKDVFSGTKDGVLVIVCCENAQQYKSAKSAKMQSKWVPHKGGLCAVPFAKQIGDF